MGVQFSLIGPRGRGLVYITGVLLVTGLLLIAARTNSAAQQKETKPPTAKPQTPQTTPGEKGKYVHQESYHKYDPSSAVYRIAVVADRDTASKTEDKSWESEIMTATLTRSEAKDGAVSYRVNFTDAFRLRSKLNEAGRAMELSELVFFAGRLWAFDDRTGVVSEIDMAKKMAIPTHILMEGDGRTNKGQKSEWATVKDGVMYVGSIGKEWTNSKGEFVHFNPQWVKTIDHEGRIASHDWHRAFEEMRHATGTSLPGYLVHEAVCWNPSNSRWYFMPRRVSKEAYDENADEERGSNTVISLDASLSKPTVTTIGPLNPKLGFSSCKFVPFRENEFVALRTMEYKGAIASYITVMTLDGKVLLQDTVFAESKFEGVEFI